MGRYKSDRQFEEDVRRIADALFELQAGECKPEIVIKGKRHAEIDGVARCRDVVHLIMATTSTKLDKVKEDVERLQLAAEQEAGRGQAVKKWMVVEKDPEAPHVTHARAEGVELLTLKQFRERFFDGRNYLGHRKNAPFGSARDPATGSASVADDEFIEPPMVNLETGASTTLNELLDRLLRGDSIVLLGQFGSGKSLSLREVWFTLRKRYLSGALDLVPTALNLREHWGAEYADEILRRHARAIGLVRESDLTAAWRAGMLVLMVDGFDEMASQGVASPGKFEVLRQIRSNALVGVRDLIAKSPRDVGVLITGRDHYFDDRAELEHALGLHGRSVVRVRVDEFDDARAVEYLRRKKVGAGLPDWLPRKPLLLGYLARRNLLESVLAIDGARGQAKAWHEFLQMICQREAEHDRAAMDPETVQRVLEHLAIQIRSASSGVGPISASMLALAYSGVTGQVAGDAVLMQLQRLPGLTERDAEPGTRSFVDQDLLETLQGCAIARRLLEGSLGKMQRQRYQVSSFDDSGWMSPIGQLGSGVAAVCFRENGWTIDALIDFIRQYSLSQFGADLLHVAMTWAAEDEVALDMHGIVMEGVHIRTVDLDEHAVNGLAIKDSILDKLILGTFSQGSTITIENTHISQVVGAGSRENLPASVHLQGHVEIGEFDPLRTTDAIVGLNIDERLKALLSALKKLFRQRGGGRVVGAFRRGVPPEVQRYIEPVLQLLVQEGFAWRFKDVYHPNRRESRRAHQMLDSPHTSSDPVFARVMVL